jgi:hypothetical protein
LQCRDERINRAAMCNEDHSDEQLLAGRSDDGGRTTAPSTPGTVPSYDGSGSTRLLVDDRTGRVSDVIVSTEYIPPRDKNLILGPPPLGGVRPRESSVANDDSAAAQKVG